ncbi:MAG: 3-methyl-2-oxobutanoate hydroxymethyltransferase [Holophaga sp.]|nr:3-methyl-2-oxobutanoate hydroxymethyltransferase [Holophaga sp.]
MSHISKSRAQVTVPDLARFKAQGRRIVMTTAYDVPTAHIADAAGVDSILVGDSLGNVCLGFENTLPVTLEMMLHHVQAVVRARPRALLLADMPYLSYHVSVEDTVRNGGALLRAGVQGVKLEGALVRIPMIKALVEAEIPVMGHLGLTPQSIHTMGGYKVQGKEGQAAIALIENALRLQDAGCFGMLLEGIPADLAARVTDALEIPTIGIGAGPNCSGQVLVFHDLLGLLPGDAPKFVRKYLDGYALMVDAMSNWANDIREGDYPGPAESYILPEATRKLLSTWAPPKI